uniref:PAS domain S-box protein n=1 Tax=Acidocella sp. TaxID=50710 RepID=UPI003FD8E94B
ELQRSEAKIRRLVDANIIGIFIYALEGRIIEANDAFLRTVGYDREDLTSGRLRWQDLTPPEWLERDEQLWVPELKATGILQPYEKEYFRKDGSRVPVLIGAASFDETGKQGVAFVLDLTERKRADQALRESEEQWKAVFENNPTMYFMVDPTGTIMSVNPFGAEHLGYTADELIGRPVQSLFHEADREIVRRHMASCLEQLGHASSWELRKIRKDGEVLWVRETARAMLIKKQPVVLIVCEDISERKLAEEAVRKVQMELAHANRVATMGQFTSSIAHEVSQPIAATIMSAQAALHWLGAEPPALEEVRQALERIVKNGSLAGEVIDKIRALIKKAPPRKDCLDINEAIREVIELTRSEAVKNSVSVQTHLADGLPLIEGDRVQLQQVILNLLINAVQAMSGVSEGGRELLISTARDEPNGVLVAVQDSGPGIAPEVLERLFEPFYTTKPGGLGLGLSICRSIIEVHGGRLWVSENVPHGAIFHFTVPAGPDSV